VSTTRALARNEITAARPDWNETERRSNDAIIRRFDAERTKPRLPRFQRFAVGVLAFEMELDEGSRGDGEQRARALSRGPLNGVSWKSARR